MLLTLDGLSVLHCPAGTVVFRLRCTHARATPSKCQTCARCGLQAAYGHLGSPCHWDHCWRVVVTGNLAHHMLNSPITVQYRISTSTLASKPRAQEGAQQAYYHIASFACRLLRTRPPL